MNKFFVTLIFILNSTGYSFNLDYSGYSNIYAINKSSNGSLIKLPFRLINYDFIISELNQNDDFTIYAKWGVEHKIKSLDSKASLGNILYNLISTQTVDYSSEFREFYFSGFLPNSEFKFGKQLHVWGAVDANSPIDVLNPIDYYYLFTDTDETKIGKFSITLDMFFDDIKIQCLAMPYTNKMFSYISNNIPSNDPNFPIELPATAQSYQFLKDNQYYGGLEWGAYIQKSFSDMDWALYYFSGYDRHFNLYGANVFLDDFDVNSVTDTVFSYRKTEMIAISNVSFSKDVTLRVDFAYFKTQSGNQSIESRPYSGRDPISDYLNFDNLAATSYFDIGGEYFQYCIQLEFGLPLNIDFTTQLFGYQKHKISGNIIDIELTNFEIYLDGKELFYPGMGSSLATLCRNGLIFNFNKTILDDLIEIQLISLIDLVALGRLMQLKLSYDLTEDMNLSFLMYHGTGNKDKYPDYSETEDIDESLLYPFNAMEDFSHIRAQLQYFF